MDIKDRFTTRSKKQLRSLVRVYKLDEITSNGARTEVLQRNLPENWSVKDRTSCKENLHLGREDDIVKIVQVEGAKCINTWGPTGAKGRPNRAEMGLGRPTQAGRPGPLRGSVRPSFSCIRRSLNPKFVEVPPFARQRAIHTERPSTS
jgi:hypothetical protein